MDAAFHDEVDLIIVACIFVMSEVYKERNGILCLSFNWGKFSSTLRRLSFVDVYVR